MSDTEKIILVLLTTGQEFSMRAFEGIQRHADSAGWRLQTVEYASDGHGGYTFVRSPSGSDVAALIEFWHPAGCIVDGGFDAAAVRPSEFGSCPTVFMDHRPIASRSRRGFVFSDPVSIAETAARELMRSDCDDFAYVPFVKKTYWSRERGDAFANAVALNRKRLHVFSYPRGTSLQTGLSDVYAEWLKALPKPCGVFAANDVIAESVLLACTRCGISVPAEIALVGADNEAIICENAHPTISSVGRDFKQQGRMAVEVLEELLAHRDRRLVTRQYKASGIVRRASTCFIPHADSRVIAAIEYIRKHACEDIGPSDVAGVMKCSRRLADLRFKESLGRTVHDEIHARRLEKVKEMLQNPRANTARISDLCGYGSVTDLRRVFKKHTGMTLREYQKSFP